MASHPLFAVSADSQLITPIKCQRADVRVYLKAFMLITIAAAAASQKPPPPPPPPALLCFHLPAEVVSLSQTHQSCFLACSPFTLFIKCCLLRFVVMYRRSREPSQMNALPSPTAVRLIKGMATGGVLISTFLRGSELREDVRPSFWWNGKKRRSWHTACLALKLKTALLARTHS